MMVLRLKSMSALCLVTALFPIAAKSQANMTSKETNVHAGAQVFLQKCFACHSVIPDQVRFGPSLYSEMKKSPHKKTAAQIRAILLNGKGKMPAFKNVISTEDLDNLLAYIRTL